MDQAMIDDICAALPGATRAEPAEGELDSWKVGGKMFACYAASRDGVTVKTPSVEAAAMLIDVGVARKARYFHRSWVLLPFDGTDADEARHRLHQSYDLIVSKLPKAVRDAL